jgi:hypothetical protein
VRHHLRTGQDLRGFQGLDQGEAGAQLGVAAEGAGQGQERQRRGGLGGEAAELSEQGQCGIKAVEFEEVLLALLPTGEDGLAKAVAVQDGRTVLHTVLRPGAVAGTAANSRPNSGSMKERDMWPPERRRENPNALA